MSCFTKDNHLVFCNNAEEFLQELVFTEKSQKWRPFINSSKISLKVVMLHVDSK